MKRRTFLTRAGAGLAATAVAAPAIAQATPQVKWRLASSFPKSLDTIYGAGAFFCERVGKLTDGKIEITPYAAGQIVPPLQVLDAVQQGTVECGHTASYYYVGKNRAFAFGCAIPFGLTSRQQSAWEYAGGGMELLREFYKEYGIIHFPAGNTGTQMGGWFKKEIKTVADLKGLKMRIPGIGGEVMGRLGCGAAGIAGEAKSTRRWSAESSMQPSGLAPTTTRSSASTRSPSTTTIRPSGEGGTELCVMINAAAWDKLPKVYQEAVESAAAEAHVKMQAQYDAKNPVALKSLIANGVKLHPFPKDLLRAANKAAFELYEAEAAKNPAFKKLYDPWKKFREQQYEWFSIAELAFESLGVSGNSGPQVNVAGPGRTHSLVRGATVLAAVALLGSPAKPSPLARIESVSSTRPGSNHPTVEGLKAGLRARGLARARRDLRGGFHGGKSDALPGGAGADQGRGRTDLHQQRSGCARRQGRHQANPDCLYVVGNPVTAGIVPDLARPGGNLTGIPVGRRKSSRSGSRNVALSCRRYAASGLSIARAIPPM